MVRFPFADCGTDYHINNGKASFAGIETTINQTAPVICDPGYETHSVKEITCLSNGSWSRGVACLKKGKHLALGALSAGAILPFSVCPLSKIESTDTGKNLLHQEYFSGIEGPI